MFSVDGPYPVDTYVRISLRRRGWVEKFGNKGNNATQKNTYSGRADTETEEGRSKELGQMSLECRGVRSQQGHVTTIESRAVRW